MIKARSLNGPCAIRAVVYFWKSFAAYVLNFSMDFL